jgi:hypothetical protein
LGWSGGWVTPSGTKAARVNVSFTNQDLINLNVSFWDDPSAKEGKNHEPGCACHCA